MNIVILERGMFYNVQTVIDGGVKRVNQDNVLFKEHALVDFSDVNVN